jgi:hypothetical protein
MNIYDPRRQPTFKDELKASIYSKIRDLGAFPVCITRELRDEITDLRDDFLKLKQDKKFTVERGVEMEMQVDRIYKDRAIACSPKLTKEEVEEEEDRKRKPTSSKSKRKICKCKKR